MASSGSVTASRAPKTRSSCRNSARSKAPWAASVSSRSARWRRCSACARVERLAVDLLDRRLLRALAGLQLVELARAAQHFRVLLRIGGGGAGGDPVVVARCARRRRRCAPRSARARPAPGDRRVPPACAPACGCRRAPRRAPSGRRTARASRPLSSRGRSATTLPPRPIRKPAKATETSHMTTPNSVSGTRRRFSMAAAAS